MRGRWRRIGLVLLTVVGLLLAWEPSRVAMQTAVMLPSLLDAGVEPLDLISAAPRRSSIPYRPDEPGREPDLAELWLPDWAAATKPAGGMLLVFGVNNLGRNHPAIERVAEGLARTGVAVLVPDSRTLLAGRLEPGEIDGIVHAFQALAARPEIDRGRLGIVGFSVGGSLALLAAADPRISAEVGWVNAFGAFGDAGEYLASVAAHAQTDADGNVEAWQPSPLALEVYLRFVLELVPDADDRRIMEDTYGATVLAGGRPVESPPVADDLRTHAARAVHVLLVAGSLEEARNAVDRLPPEAQLFLRAISPLEQVGRMRADVYLMHERDDHHVPIAQSRALADPYRSVGLLEAYTEFRLFTHVQPDDLDLVAATPELWKLLWHVNGLMVETL